MVKIINYQGTQKSKIVNGTSGQSSLSSLYQWRKTKMVYEEEYENRFSGKVYGKTYDEEYKDESDDYYDEEETGKEETEEE